MCSILFYSIRTASYVRVMSIDKTILGPRSLLCCFSFPFTLAFHNVAWSPIHFIADQSQRLVLLRRPVLLNGEKKQIKAIRCDFNAKLLTSAFSVPVVTVGTGSNHRGDRRAVALLPVVLSVCSVTRARIY